MGMFKKKPDAPKPIKVSQEELAHRISETAGMLPDEIVRLLDSLAHVDRTRTIIQRKPGDKKSLFGRSKETKGKVVAALDHAVKHLEERIERENLVRKKKKDLPERPGPIFDEDYPQRLVPADIARSIQGARVHLEMLEEQRAVDPITDRKADLVLRIMQKLKKYEATRVAREIAMKQRRLYEATLREHKGEYVPPEASMTKEEAEKQLLKAQQQLQGFGHGLRTLIDDAAEVVEDNYDAATSVVRQWIGTATQQPE